MSGGPATRRVLIIVPAWNEQDAITSTIEEILACVPDADLLVVDDGSSDHTAARAAAAGATVCPLPFNLGVGGAMRTGYRYALRNGYDAAVQIDADGQHDPRYLPRCSPGSTAPTWSSAPASRPPTTPTRSAAPAAGP